jgi:hypothetical protein
VSTLLPSSVKDAEKARGLVESALNRDGDLYRLHGPDTLIRAAQVYATLATR